jgi:hypothetical protein
MKLAYFALCAFFLSLFVGAAYGFSIDRFAGIIGAAPGLIGLCGLTLCRDDIDARAAWSRTRASIKRRDNARRIHAMRGSTWAR